MGTLPRGRRWPAVVPARVAGLLAVVATAAIALASCAVPASPGGEGDETSGGGASSASDGSPRARLVGRTFLSTAVVGHDLVAGSTIRLEFADDGQVWAGAGCNSMSGAARWNGPQLTVADLGMTEMGCEQPLMDQDSWLSGLLTSGLRAALDDDVLTLSGDDVRITLADRRVVDPDRPLQGTTWVLDGIITGGGESASVSSVPPGITATLRIGDGKIHFFDGLNDYDGPTGPDAALTVGAERVQITGEIGGSGVGCATGQQCSVDMSVLTEDFGYRITAGGLTVTGVGPTAGHGLMFRAADDVTGAAVTEPGPVPAELIGHTFRLTRLFTDAGGADTKYPDATFTITFREHSADATSNCGDLRYPSIRYRSDRGVPMVDLGTPVRSTCPRIPDLGTDPVGVPSGELMFGYTDGEMWLSTGFVAWYFEREP